jgi:hypothetical protein
MFSAPAPDSFLLNEEGLWASSATSHHSNNFQQVQKTKARKPPMEL